MSNVLARVWALTSHLHLQYTGSVSHCQNLNLEAPAQLDMSEANAMDEACYFKQMTKARM